MEAKSDPERPGPTQGPLEEPAACPVGEAGCTYPGEVERLRGELNELALQVHTDALTGLYNYRHFSELLVQEVERSRRSGLALALIMVDLDFFKRVNDQWGHEAGNETLKCVADILRCAVRRIDSVCRYGGEEMVLVLPGTVLPRAVKVAERLREAIESVRIPAASEPFGVTASFGAAVYPGQGAQDAPSLIQAADAQLYRAKQEGRNRVCHAPLVAEVQDTQVTADEKKALLE